MLLLLEAALDVLYIEKVEQVFLNIFGKLISDKDWEVKMIIYLHLAIRYYVVHYSDKVNFKLWVMFVDYDRMEVDVLQIEVFISRDVIGNGV